jgi:hypothetical protein
MNERSEGQISTADLAYGRQEESEQRKTEDERTSTDPAHDSGEATAPLFPEADAEGYRGRWQEIQTRFVDEPQNSVREADSLVAEVVQKLATRFAEERETLENQWGKGTEASTEDLRVALQHYRSFFQRLLAA